MEIVTLVGIVEIVLRGTGAPVIRLCDGGFVNFGGNIYSGSDAAFGTIAAVEPISEGVGDEIPAGRISFLPVSTASAATLSQPGYQGSRMRFWIGEVDAATGLITGTPKLMFDGQTDRTVLKTGKAMRILEMEFVSRAERLFVQNEGNSLSVNFHKSIYPGELGLDNATGVSTSVAWGVASAPRGVSSGGTYGGIGGGYRSDLATVQVF